MASPATTIGTLPHHAGVGMIRRYAATVLGRRPRQADARLRLRGALPLRYPGDSKGLEYDPLTKLATQPVFSAALLRCVGSSAATADACSLVLFDVDNLSETNQRRGYVMGDELLREAAAAVRRQAGPEGRAFRIGGDEFALLMPGKGVEEAEQRAATILAELQEPDGDTIPGTMSAGVSGGSIKAREHDVLYRQAQAALVDVKRNGKGAVAIFDPARHQLAAPTSAASLELIERIISQRLLRPVFQPIIDLRSGQALGFEGLVRVLSGTAPPGASELFAAAEAADRVAELDLACIDAVIGGARAIRPDRLLAMNLSPRTLAGRAFEPTWLLERLVHAGISPSRVVVELSDDEPIEDLDRLRTTFRELQRLGIRAAADDVTVEDPTRHLLTHLPFDIVKIDLARIWEGAQTGPRLAGLRDFAYRHSARVIAEGVETSEQLVAVRDLEFGAAQGYLLGRPDASVVDHVLELEHLQSAVEWPAAERISLPLLRPDDAASAAAPVLASPRIMADVQGSPI